LSEEDIVAFPEVIIDDSDKELFELAQGEAKNLFEGETNEFFIYRLLKKGKMLRFTHDFEGEKLYIDFPDKKK